MAKSKQRKRKGERKNFQQASNKTNQQQSSKAVQQEETASKNVQNEETASSADRGTTKKVLVALTVVAIPCLAVLAPQILSYFGYVHEDNKSEGLSDFFNASVFRSLEAGWGRLNGSIGGSISPEEKRPGYQLAQQGAKVKHNVIMIPGFVTTALELWAGEPCAKKHFRRRLWGSASMAEGFLRDKTCWMQHLSLDPHTGGDPENIRLRACQGLDAADYFIGNYWVFGKLIENLADVGYDSNSMHMMSYDWRVAYPLLEERDGYFTKLKTTIEVQVKLTGKKVVMVSHSMGGTLTLYFFQWVTATEEEGGGGGGKDWVEKHIHAYVNIAGALLGATKTVPALLSGEMRDTAEIFGAVGDLMEMYLGRKQRKDMFSTWGALWSLMPKGGDAIWGVGADTCVSEDAVSALKCGENASITENEGNNPMITFTEDDQVGPENDCKEDDIECWIASYGSKKHRTLDETIHFLQKWGAGHGKSLSASKHYDFFQGSDKKKVWHDATAVPLPKAPSMKIYCLYGVGINTERSYYYKRGPTTEEDVGPADPPFIMNATIQDESLNTKYGVTFADGDESVPLISLGYMCADGWVNNKEHNPSKLEVITRECAHEPSFEMNDPTRTGPRSGSHIDIMGNEGVLRDVVQIATGYQVTELKQNIVSDIEGIAKRINSHLKGGIKGKTK